MAGVIEAYAALFPVPVTSPRPPRGFIPYAYVLFASKQQSYGETQYTGNDTLPISICVHIYEESETKTMQELRVRETWTQTGSVTFWTSLIFIDC